MKKDRLKTGMQVELRENYRMMVLLNTPSYYNNTLVDMDDESVLNLADYNDDLTHRKNSDYDIIKIYSPTKSGRWQYLSKLSGEYVVWERGEGLKQYHLFLEEVNVTLYVCYSDEKGDKRVIGHINKLGECHFMATNKQKENYTEWLYNKPPKQEESERVEFFGNIYIIDRNFFLRAPDFRNGYVYSFGRTRPIASCRVSGLKCYPNGSIILH